MKNEFKKYAVKHLGINSTKIEGYSKFLNNKLYNSYISPTIIEERKLNVAQMDIYSRLMLDRIIFLGTAIDDDVANIINGQLLFLESVDKSRDIQLYINSPGGSVYSGLAIKDVMDYIKPDVATICMGLAASMGSVLLSNGQKGKRSALKHSRIMLHQPMGGIGGGTQESDITIYAKEISLIKKELYDILSENTGKSYKQIEKDADRDFWLRSDDAIKYGIIDEILTKK